MKKYTSVFKLIARHSFYKVLILLGIMAAAEVILFCLIGADRFRLFRSTEQFLLPIYLCALGSILTFSMSDKHSKVSYTLMRLRISKTTLFCIQGIYNMLVLLLLFLTRIVAVIGIVFRHMGVSSGLVAISAYLSTTSAYTWLIIGLFFGFLLLFFFGLGGCVRVFVKTPNTIASTYFSNFWITRFFLDNLFEGITTAEGLFLAVLVGITLIMYIAILVVQFFGIGGKSDE